MTQDDPLPALADGDLLSRIAAGDLEAFSALYRRRRGDVYRFAVHMTGSLAVADDVTQEVFLAVMRCATRFQQDRATVIAWLCGIARNHVRRCLEHDRPMQPLFSGEGASDLALVMHADPVGDLERGQRLERLRRAVLALPLRYREAVVLCDLQELSYADAALALDCAVGTVRSRLHRARALLAVKLTAAEETTRTVKSGRARCIA